MRDRPNDHHRTLTERELGRKLGPNEVVDHVDEDKANNRRDNRRVMSRADHTKQHNAGRPLSRLRAALRAVREGKKQY